MKVFIWVLFFMLWFQGISMKSYGNYFYDLLESYSFQGDAGNFIGDVNGDGIQDCAIYNSLERSISVYYGDDYDRSHSIKGVGKYGFSIRGFPFMQQVISPAGDMNLDGYDDFMFRYDHMIYLVFGKPSQKSFNITSFSKDEGITISLLDSSLDIGTSLITIGDFNGDKAADILIGVGMSTAVLTRTYFMYLVYGFPHHIPDSIILDSSEENEQTGFFIGNKEGVLIDYSLASVGDLNRDGYSDIAIGYSAQWTVYLIFGARSTESIYFDDGSRIPKERMLKVTFDDPAEDNLFGIGVSSAGDCNGDGLLDLAISAGRTIFILFGKKQWKDHIQISLLTFQKADGYRLIDNVGLWEHKPFVGGSLSLAGDINGDGLSDLLIRIAFSKIVYLIYGARKVSEDLLLSTIGSRGVALQGTSRYAPCNAYGNADLDNDGIPDILIDQPPFSYNSEIHFISGKELRTGLIHEVDMMHAAQFTEIYRITPIGDYNGDGVDDIISLLAEAHFNITPIAVISLGHSQELIDKTIPITVNESELVVYDRFPTRITRSFSYIIVPLNDLNEDGMDDFFITSTMKDYGYGSMAIVFGSNSMSKTIHIHSPGADDGVKIIHPYHSRQETMSTAVDFNGDGKQDIIIRSLVEGRYQLWIIYGRKEFPLVFDITVESKKNSGSVLIIPIENRFESMSSLLGDINHDGYEDLLVNINSDRLMVLHGKPDYSTDIKLSLVYQLPHADNRTSLLVLGINSFTTGDINGDGYLDILITFYSRKIGLNTDPIILLGNSQMKPNPNDIPGNFTILQITGTEHRYGTNLRSKLIDLNQDGFAEIIFVSSNKMSIIFGGKDIASVAANVKRSFISINTIALDEVINLQDYNNDSFPEFSISNRLFPAQLFAEFFPVTNDPSKADTRQTPKHDHDQLFRRYIRAIIEELIVFVVVLICAIVLFLLIGRPQAQKMVGTTHRQAVRRHNKNQDEIELTEYAPQQPPPIDYQDEELTKLL